MKKDMKIRIAISALVLTASSISQGQAVPTVSPSMAPSNSGMNLSPLDGVFHYALTASEIVQLGYYGPGNVTSSTTLSGDGAYTAKSELRPFSLLFAGGASLPNQAGEGTSGFVSAAVSQGYITRKWVFNVSDSFSFLPQSPTTGLSGIAGVGDIGVIPVQGPVEGPAGGIFSNAGNRISNDLSGSVERQITHDTSLSGSGSWAVLHFLDASEDNGAIDSSQVSGTVAVNRRLDARSSVSLNAVYSTISYSGTYNGFSEPDIETRGINVTYQRILSRSFSVNASAGPQWVSSSNSTLVPSNLNVAATASLSYSRRSTNASVSYSRGVNAGSGVLPGALSDSVSGGVGHSYGRDWVASLDAGYTHTSGLTQVATGGSSGPAYEVYNTVFGGAQVRRRISAYFSGYVSYVAQSQSNNYSLGAQNAYSGTTQTFGIGITYSPRTTRLGQF